MAKPIKARVRIFRRPRNNFDEPAVEMEIDVSELQEGDIVIEYIPD